MSIRSGLYSRWVFSTPYRFLGVALKGVLASENRSKKSKIRCKPQVRCEQSVEGVEDPPWHALEFELVWVTRKDAGSRSHSHNLLPPTDCWFPLPPTPRDLYSEKVRMLSFTAEMSFGMSQYEAEWCFSPGVTRERGVTHTPVWAWASQEGVLPYSCWKFACQKYKLYSSFLGNQV